MDSSSGTPSRGPLRVDLTYALIILFVWIHLVLAPYTKVEESFNIQATHDVLAYGLPISNVYERLSSAYDHFTFPGAVPRTFVGPVLLAWFHKPMLAVIGNGPHSQHVVRCGLGIWNAAAMMAMMYGVQKTFGRGAARWYALLQSSQFHVMFYASRTLPNMFAFGLTTFAYSQLLLHSRPFYSKLTGVSDGTLSRQRLAVALFVFAAVIFRSEVALLLFTIIGFLVLYPVSNLETLIPAFVVSFIAALLISVPLDSYFWQKPLWPELWGFYYNAVLGSSSAWGVSPWHWYFTSALPRLFLNPLVYLLLIPTAWRKLGSSPATKLLIVPALLFVEIYSLQPHKEARFIFYVVPPLTAAAASGASWISARRDKSPMYRLATYLIVLSVLASYAASIAMLLVSSLNYPGGEALAHLRNERLGNPAYDRIDALLGYEPDPHDVRVHADVLSCMTGVTLFGASDGPDMPLWGSLGMGVQNRTEHHIILDKTEDPATLSDPDFWAQIDYVLAEDPTTIKGGRWDEVGVVEAYAGIEVLRPGMTGADVEKGYDRRLVVQRGMLVGMLKEKVRSLTGGWWVGPRMEPRVHILKRVKGER